MIDGSYGEGGGQILRTAVAISTILGKPVEVRRIRAKRDRPGLRPQHIAAIRGLASLCDASVENLRMGSDNIRFTPGKIRLNNLKLDVGSAGSITLILQALIPAASLGGTGTELEVTGGTDVKWSPTLDYFRRVVLPAYSLIGIQAEIQVVRRGYYPKGEGFVRVLVKPCRELGTLNLVSSPVHPPSIFSTCSNLPRNVAERQLSSARNWLADQQIALQETSVTVEEAISPGSSILICSVGEGGPFIGGDAVGERGKPAEFVGREAAGTFLNECRSGAPIDTHLGDMMILPLSLARRESRFRIPRISSHLTTNLYVTKQLAGCESKINQLSDGTSMISMSPVS